MPDHSLPPTAVSAARPPTYSFADHRAAEDTIHERLDAVPAVPDRSATASAPPDLEISSRSLFAFKADYSGIFSDIRMDEDYESFYNDNPQRSKLPPPLPPSQGAALSPRSARPPHLSIPPASSSDSFFQHVAAPRLDASSNMSSLPPRTPRQPASTTPTKFASLNMHPSNHLPLRRDDSDASFEELIFRVSRSMTPIPSNVLNFPNVYRDDQSFSDANVARPVDNFHLGQTGPNPSSSSQPPHRRSDNPPSHSQPHAANCAESASPSPASQFLENGRSQCEPGQVASHLPHRPQHDGRSSPPPQSSAHHQLRTRHQPQQSPSLQQPSNVPQQQPSHSQPQPHVSQLQKDQQAALWKLDHLSLDNQDNFGTASRSVSSGYPNISSTYDSIPSSRSPFNQSFSNHHQPHGNSPPSVVNSSGVPSAHQLSPVPYMAPAHRSVQSQDWPPNSTAEAPQKVLNSYEQRGGMASSFMSPNAAGIGEMFNFEGSDDPLVGFGAQSQALAGIAYNAGEYREGGVPQYHTSRSSYISHHPSSPGARIGTSRGRSQSPHRVDSAAGRYGYMGYGSGNSRHSNYGSARARAVPVSAEYVNAQAAAAAAAAAAAVYQSNGVHINGAAGLAPLRGNGASMGSSRSVGSRNGVRSGDSRRGSGSGHQEGYIRNGSTGGCSVRGNSNGQERGILDRNNSGENGGNATNGTLKFSSFSDVIGRAEELARDQHGCRFLQTKLEEGNVVYINSIFEECYEKFVDLMTDPFGNYLCQKLFELCNDAQRLALVERCASAIPHVSTNMHGTRAVQRMVECLSTTEQVRAVCDALSPAAVNLMKDINGNHVIQRCLNRMDPVHNQFVYDAVASNCFELATHRHGCCVMQRCMDFASPMQRNQLAMQINANALPLVQNAFGNYVVQYVLELNDSMYTTEIIRRLRGHLAELSMQKFSSNVVEKGLQLGSRESRRELIDELILEEETMKRLLHDAYGNYVIQRALQIAEGPQLERICEAIRPHLNSLKQSPYGKRIQAKIVKRMPKGIGGMPSST